MPSDSTPPPLFSILLPTHNRADVLPFAIRSVLNQTVADFELLIVGDGCTDQTATVVQSFTDPRIRWFDLPKAPNFGYANRNVALRQTRGKFIAFMAHDDLWLPDHLQLLGPLLEQPGVELAYSRPLWVIPPGLLAPMPFNLDYAPTLANFIEKRQNGIAAACVVHLRACFAKYGYWNESLPSCGDCDMWARIIDRGGRKNFQYFSEPTCLHFRANWRNKPSLLPSCQQVWEHLHQSGNFIPPALKIPVPQGVSEQQAALENMSRDPSQWCRELRSAVRQVLDQRVIQCDQLLAEKLAQASAPPPAGFPRRVARKLKRLATGS